MSKVSERRNLLRGEVMPFVSSFDDLWTDLRCIEQLEFLDADSLEYARLWRFWTPRITRYARAQGIDINGTPLSWAEDGDPDAGSRLLACYSTRNRQPHLNYVLRSTKASVRLPPSLAYQILEPSQWMGEADVEPLIEISERKHAWSWNFGSPVNTALRRRVSTRGQEELIAEHRSGPSHGGCLSPGTRDLGRALRAASPSQAKGGSGISPSIAIPILIAGYIVNVNHFYAFSIHPKLEIIRVCDPSLKPDVLQRHEEFDHLARPTSPRRRQVYPSPCRVVLPSEC